MADSDMDTPVTRRELREELANYPTKQDLRDELANYPTKQDLRDELANYPTKQDLRDELANYSTKQDLQEAIDRAFERMPTALDIANMMDAVARMPTALDIANMMDAIARMPTALDIANMIDGAFERMHADRKAIDEPLVDVPERVRRLEETVEANADLRGRVVTLEAKVFTAPKRRRRAAK